MSANNNKHEKVTTKLEIVLFVMLFIFLATVAFLIGIAVKSNEWKDPITIDNWLIYYGTISGSLIGGFITATGLFFTLKQNSKTILEQRKFDRDAMKKQNEQFEKDYNLRLINQKLNTYKEIFLLVEEVINKAVSINHKVVLDEHLDEWNAMTKRKGIRYNHIKDIEELYELSNKFNFMLVFITEESIRNLSKEAFKVLETASDQKEKCEKNEISKNSYIGYYTEISTAYTKISQEIKKVSEDIYLNNFVKDMNVRYSN